MSVLKGFVALAACIALLAPATASAGNKDRPGGKSAVTCNLPESNAEALVILSNYYPGYWWDHTNLTIAVQAHPSATDEQLEAIDDAIATWSTTLEECFDGLITLTNVTGSKRKQADIVVHYVPTAGGGPLRWLRDLRRSRMSEHPGPFRSAPQASESSRTTRSISGG